MELTADTDLFGIKELAGENTTSSALFPRLTNEVLKLDMAVQKTLVRFNGRGFEAASITAFSGVEPSKPTRDEFEVLHIQVDRGVKKVSRHFEPVKNGILIAPVINISAEIADQSAAIQSSQSFAPAPGMHRLTGDFADDGFIHGTSR